MESFIGAADYVIIGLMLVVSACVGIYFRFTGERQKTTQEFLLAGKNMSIGPVAFSLMATYLSTIFLLGAPSEIYIYGTQFCMRTLGVIIGSIIAGYGLLPVFFDLGVSTSYEYLERRFGQTTRTISSVLFSLQMVLYIAVVLYAPSVALNTVTGLPTWLSLITIATVCTFYSTLGGLKAVLWTDVFQSLLMYAVTIAVLTKGSMDFGGIGKIFDTAYDGGRLIFFNLSLSLTERYTLLNSIVSGIVFSLHGFGINQTQVQRILSIGKLKKAQIALICSFPLIVSFNLLCYLDGIVIYSYFHDCDPLQYPEGKLSKADQLMPYIILKLFGDIPGLPGLCISGIISASLSTISSALNSLTAVAMEDFIRPFCFCKQLTESRRTFLAKIIALSYGILCILLTVLVANFSGIIEAANVLFSIVGGPSLGIYILGMFTTRANEPGTLIGLLFGFIINAWISYGSATAKIKKSKLPLSTAGCPTILNDTWHAFTDYNGTRIFQNYTTDIQEILDVTDNKAEYVLPLYKLSYMWFALIGVIVVITVGYVASFIIGIWKKYPIPNEKILSPFVRKLYFKSSKA